MSNAIVNRYFGIAAIIIIGTTEVFCVHTHFLVLQNFRFDELDVATLIMIGAVEL